MTRLPSLTSLRWFAASLVFLGHANPLLDASWEERLGPVSKAGPAGVGFFFILSGFVLSWNDTHVAIREFYRRRFARVVPAYMVAAGLGVLLVADDGPRTIARGLFTFTLLQSWVPSVDEWNFAGNAVGWSLSTEVFFYALFPLLIGPVAALGRQGLLALFVAVVTAAIGWRFLFPNTSTDVTLWATYIAPPVRLLEFVGGMCLARLLLAGVRLRIPVAASLLLVLLSLSAAYWAPDWTRNVVIPLLPFCLLIFVVAQADLERRPTGLKHPWLIRLGQWSYGFYLVHQLVTRTFEAQLDFVTGTTGRFAVYLGAYGAATIGAYLLFTLVEHPLERRIRGGGTSMPAAEPALAAAAR